MAGERIPTAPGGSMVEAEDSERLSQIPKSEISDEHDGDGERALRLPVRP